MVEFEPAIKALVAKKVDFVIIGGVAISVHSSGYITRDLDFCYLRTTENLKKIVTAFIAVFICVNTDKKSSLEICKLIL